MPSEQILLQHLFECACCFYKLQSSVSVSLRGWLLSRYQSTTMYSLPPVWIEWTQRMNYLKDFTLPEEWSDAKDSHIATSHLKMSHFSLRNMRLEKLIQKYRPILGQMILGETQSCENVIKKEMELPGQNGVRSLDVSAEYLLILRYLRNIFVCITI